MRIPDDEWDEVGDAVKQIGSNRTEITREFFRWYVRRPGAKMPKRPTPEEDS